MGATKGTHEEIREVLAAGNARDLFGTNEKSARIRYRRLVRAIHPDANGGSPQSAEATKKLNRLWEEFEATLGRRGDRSATGDASASAKRPVELTRNGSYVLFREDGRWLIVRRTPGSGTASQKAVATSLRNLLDILAGSPVTVPACCDAKSILQSDGSHEAFVADVPRGIRDGEHALTLDDVACRLPTGKLHPADLAWVAKRVLFLAAALSKAGLAPLPGTPVPEMLAIDPEGHMLVLMTPWDLGNGDGSVKSQRAVTTPVLDRLAELAAGDGKSADIVRFFRGIGYDRVTESSDLLAEFDELLDETFGGRAFHAMEIDLPDTTAA